MRSDDLYQKEVINIKTAKRLGYVSDIDIDPENGQILSIIIPKHKFFFLKQEDITIPWDNIVLISEELILTECNEEEIILP